MMPSSPDEWPLYYLRCANRRAEESSSGSDMSPLEDYALCDYSAAPEAPSPGDPLYARVMCWMAMRLALVLEYSAPRYVGGRYGSGDVYPPFSPVNAPRDSVVYKRLPNLKYLRLYDTDDDALPRMKSDYGPMPVRADCPAIIDYALWWIRTGHVCASETEPWFPSVLWRRNVRSDPSWDSDLERVVYDSQDDVEDSSDYSSFEYWQDKVYAAFDFDESGGSWDYSDFVPVDDSEADVQGWLESHPGSRLRADPVARMFAEVPKYRYFLPRLVATDVGEEGRYAASVFETFSYYNHTHHRSWGDDVEDCGVWRRDVCDAKDKGELSSTIFKRWGSCEPSGSYQPDESGSDSEWKGFDEDSESSGDSESSDGDLYLPYAYVVLPADNALYGWASPRIGYGVRIRIVVHPYVVVRISKSCYEKVIVHTDGGIGMDEEVKSHLGRKANHTYEYRCVPLSPVVVDGAPSESEGDMVSVGRWRGSRRMVWTTGSGKVLEPFQPVRIASGRVLRGLVNGFVSIPGISRSVEQTYHYENYMDEYENVGVDDVSCIVSYVGAFTVLECDYGLPS